MAEGQQALASLKKSRASLQGHLTRHKKRFVLHQKVMDVSALQAMSTTIEQIETRFLDLEEKIVILENVDENENGEIEASSAYDKFMDEYDDLKGKILALIEEKKPKGPDLNATLNALNAGNRPMKHFHLPKLNIPEFSGNKIEWIDFKNEFLSAVKDESLTDIERFRYLRSALGPVPKRIVSNMEVTEENYKKAWDALDERFDNTSMIFRSHINNFLSLQEVCGDFSDKHRELLDSAMSHFRALTSIGTMENLAENLMICVMLRKLDSNSQAEWEKYTDNTIATWDEFTSFFSKHCTTMENVRQSKQQLSSKLPPSPNKTGKKLQTTLLTESKPESCKKCNNSSHIIKDCPLFIAMNPRDRCEEVKRLKVCMKCLGHDHSFKRCQVKCAKCRKGHNFLLHFELNESQTSSYDQASGSKPYTPPKTTPPRSSSTPTVSQTYLADNIQEDTAIIGSVVVDLIDDSGNRFPVHALLDSGSTTHIVSEAVARLLNAKISKRGSVIGGVGATCSKISGRCKLRMSCRDSNESCDFYASTMSKISGAYPSSPFDISSWKIPHDIKLANPKFNLPQKVDLLIGAGLFWTMLLPGRLTLGANLPYLQETQLGWIVVGPVTPSLSSETTLAAIDPLEEVVQRFWELETFPTDSKTNMSLDDQYCEDLFNRTTIRDQTGRFVVQLPFKQNAPKLGRSDLIARQRFFNLERKLSRDPTVKKMYADFIEEYERLGHLERIDDFDFEQPHYFIPHHCVLKPTSSTTKLRVVFDASAKSSNGVSLNDTLHSGPKIQENLFVILLRFRLFRYVLTADVQKMYRQTLIDPNHTNFQMIYWRENDSSPLQTLRLKTVTYGTAPGAYLAIRSLQQLAKDEKSDFPRGSDIVLKHFYVDDALFGSNTLYELDDALQELIELLSKGGLALGKICSNSKSILEGIPSEKREKVLKIDDHEVIRTLGLLWEPESDTFHYCSEDVSLSECTKRNVLSTMARIFDPLGLISPVVCLAKIFYQDLWKLKLDWDTPLPSELQDKWTNFCTQLSQLKHISIPRYILCGPKPKSVEVHGFSDASERAYGACVYLRSYGPDNEWKVELACARSKVAPTNVISIARLELCAAKMLVDLVIHLKEKVLNDIQITSETFWTDSAITLSWITSEPHKWATFVAHRVTKIREKTSISDWRHISGSGNPADLVSRGIVPAELATADLWWHGPLFLRHSSYEWPAEFVPNTPLDDIEEFRAPKTVLLTTDSDDVTRSMRFSVGFRGTRRAFAYVLRFIKNARNKNIPKAKRIACLHNMKYDDIPIPDIAEEIHAEEIFVRSIQQSTFPDEFNDLLHDRPVSKKSRLAQLSPFIHDGLLRVGGRLSNTNLAFDSKHQILLPGEHPYTNSLVFYYHHYRTFHAGYSTTLVAIRTRYWPLSSTILVRRVSHNCLWCFRMKPRFLSQIMGNLPDDRVNPKELRAFNVTGVDFAGPFNVRHHIRCKQEKKVYLALFICMATKAVHVELIPDLSSEAFLRGMSRFISDRGNVSKIFSDNGTNFKGAAKKLQEMSQEMEDACRKWHIEWSFIPPRTPHHGGVWEASIKLLKRLVASITQGAGDLTEDELRTFSKQAAAIINSRPITTISSDPNDLEPLTPSHFIHGGPSAALPEIPVKIPDNVKSIHTSRRLAVVNQQLWKRFSKEYLQLLQPRTKWLTRQNKFELGSLVLLKEDNLPPLKWSLGRLVNVFPSKDGVVRVVEVKTSSGTYKRGITGVALLPDGLQPNKLHGGETVVE